MVDAGSMDRDHTFHILAVTQGQWGERIAAHIKDHAPADWQVEIWAAPRMLPPVIDDPEDFLPPTLPQADLVLALGEVPGLAQLVPDIVSATGAKAVIAPIDRNPSLPPGLARQLKQWLDQMQVPAVFPKPFCSLTEDSFNRTPLTQSYDDPLIRRFASHFGKPSLRLDIEDDEVRQVEVLRDAACGCGRHVAENLIGSPVNEAHEKSGMLHHHYPCLAEMNKDPDYRDTLMHVSGNILKDMVLEELRSLGVSQAYLRPSGLVGGESDSEPQSGEEA